MVKAPSSQRASSCSPPFGSLSLLSTPLKPCKPSLSFSFQQKRPPLLVHGQSMDPSSSSRSSASTYSQDDASSTDNALFQQVDRHQTSKSAETTSSTEEAAVSGAEKLDSMCGRQRLQQHRIQMSGNVIIPETWGREQQLQEWVSYGIVEDALRPAGLMSAQSALVSDCQHREKKAVRPSPPMTADVEVS